MFGPTIFGFSPDLVPITSVKVAIARARTVIDLVLITTADIVI